MKPFEEGRQKGGITLESLSSLINTDSEKCETEKAFRNQEVDSIESLHLEHSRSNTSLCVLPKCSREINQLAKHHDHKQI